MKVFLIITAVICVILLNLIVIAALKAAGRNRDWEAEDRIQAEEMSKRRQKQQDKDGKKIFRLFLKGNENHAGDRKRYHANL